MSDLDSYIYVLEQLNISRTTLKKIQDICMRTMAVDEEDRDYSEAFDEIIGTLMSDDSREWIDKCG